MNKNVAPRVIVFAGPNGAGKTTHAEPILKTIGISTFVNADFIARGLSGRDTESVAFEAGRIMLNRLRELASSKADFAFESTLSSRTFARFLSELKQQGYLISLFYFSLKSAPLAVQRVKLRVRLGGHAVPAEIVKRRFARSVSNFFTLYAPIANEWTLFDNSAGSEAQSIASYDGIQLDIQDDRAWQRIQRLAALAPRQS